MIKYAFKSELEISSLRVELTFYDQFWVIPSVDIELPRTYGQINWKFSH